MCSSLGGDPLGAHQGYAYVAQTAAVSVPDHHLELPCALRRELALATTPSQRLDHVDRSVHHALLPGE